MPTRIIRDGILTSERMALLGWPEEVFYRRLMSVADDYGRFYANPALLRAACYPLHLSKVSDSDIVKWLTACVNAALVRVYPAKDGKRYLEVLDFGQRQQSKSKFPAFGEAEQESTVIHGDPPEPTVIPRLVGVGVGVEDEDEDVGEAAPRKRGKQPKVAMPADFAVSERVRTWAAEKGHGRLDERLEHFKSKARANGYTYADWDEAFMGAIRDDWAKLGAATTGLSRPQANTPKQAMAPSETPLERAVSWARQQHHMGQINEAERDRLIAAATQKHRGQS